jgi:hypothetical protein
MTVPERLESFRASLLARCEEVGARVHPPLAEGALKAYEQRHGVTLPEPYRVVLSLVGNGWESDDGSELMSLSPLVDHPNLSQPFPYPSAVLQEDSGEWLLAENGGKQSKVNGVRELLDEAPGLISLCEVDSGQYWFLVANGVARGTVWMFDANSQSFGHLFGVVDFIERTIEPQLMIRQEEDYPLAESRWESPKPVLKRYLVTGFFEVYGMTAFDGRPLAQVLGEPTANQVVSKTGAVQTFERGKLTWVSGLGITAVDAEGNVVFKNF